MPRWRMPEAGARAMEAFIRTYGARPLQQPMDAAVVIPSILRPALADAVKSIFAQRFPGHIHILVGIDRMLGEFSSLEKIFALCPSHCTVQVYWPGYSTSQRHGGLTPPADGGALRCVLTHMANSPYVAYLDDDNWWSPDHLAQMRTAIDEVDWAFALRWFVHPVSRRPVCVDNWESVGPGQGIFNNRFGGFVDPNCLMLNKVKCHYAPIYWNFPLANDPGSADRNVFSHLSKNYRSRGTGQASVFYKLNPDDAWHAQRMRMMGDAYSEVGDSA